MSARTSWSAAGASRQLTVSLFACTLSLVSACSKHIPLAAPAAPLTPPTRLCGPGEGSPSCRTTENMERLLEADDAILGMADPPSGSQGAKILTLRASAGTQAVFRAKWRPESSADLINEPRKELASYAVQKLFLEDTELVAPPTVAHCFPIEEYRRFDRQAKATFPGLDCVFGFASYWLEHVSTVDAARKAGQLGNGDGIWDARLFEKDSVYRRSVSNANLLTYVINHGDAHNEQFLLQPTGRGLRAYVVDNSIAFLSIPNPMLLFREDWSKIQVPKLTRQSVERLRKLQDADYARLGSIFELQIEGRQLVHPMRPSEHLESDGKAMSWLGSRLRIGLTTKEIELVKSRVRDLLQRPDLAQITDS